VDRVRLPFLVRKGLQHEDELPFPVLCCFEHKQQLNKQPSELRILEAISQLNVLAARHFRSDHARHSGVSLLLRRLRPVGGLKRGMWFGGRYSGKRLLC
jgi:hypothetical protein